MPWLQVHEKLKLTIHADWSLCSARLRTLGHTIQL